MIYDARGKEMGVLRMPTAADRQWRRARFFEIVREIWALNRDVSPSVIEEEVARAVPATRARRGKRRLRVR